MEATDAYLALWAFVGLLGVVAALSGRIVAVCACLMAAAIVWYASMNVGFVLASFSNSADEDFKKGFYFSVMCLTVTFGITYTVARVCRYLLRPRPPSPPTRGWRDPDTR